MRALVAIVVIVLIAPFGSASSSSNSSSIMGVDRETSSLSHLDGSGVVIAVADTGIDMDHSCFRNSTDEVGIPGSDHRKIIHLNDTVDNWDNQGHQQFKHGTHIAGILACDNLEGNTEMNSLSNGSRLVVQDIVGSNGWDVPAVEELLAEASEYGAVINSWSWGDNTINYTNRSKTIDLWTSENPWSLVFVAPGNNGGMMLEPSNAYNVVSVAASDSEKDAGMWPSSSKGPDVNGRRGTLVSAPGVNVISAKSDGNIASMNNGSYSMTGTSMATPMAASFTALLQQMIEEEYGYTPSAPLLRSMLAASAEPVTGLSPDSVQGYGRPSLSSFENGLFIHDSYAIDDWASIIQSRGGTLEDLLANPWNGSGAAGPFLSENESWKRLLKPVRGEDLEVVLSYNVRPAEFEIDDLRLMVRTSDGRVAVDDQVGGSGYSQLYYQSVYSPLTKNSSNETTVMIRIPADKLVDVDWVEIEVVANSITEGDAVGTLGVNGTMVGFGLVATGVEELQQNNGPSILMISGPEGGENYTEEILLDLEISDGEGDGVAIAIRLVNSNYSIDLEFCEYVSISQFNVSCNVNINRDLIPAKVNRHDWFFEVVALDNNSSIWTGPEFTLFSTDNFTIWWESPLRFDQDGWPPVEESIEKQQNQTLFLGILGVITGVVVAASVMFSRFENGDFKNVKPPFREEE
tara:strand:+ start:1333 stop:3396 length:2064 start_codon:yes stop_codon:yes gene_type:complete